MFLLYLLRMMHVSFVAVHIDHGWRKESAEEAVMLKSICSDLEVPCVVHRLDQDCMLSDVENRARNARWELFFQEIVTQNAHGIFFAHHADDQVETVLKRVLEGAPFTKLVGMRRVSNYHGVPCYRPLLHLHKVLMLDILHRSSISYVDDYTNRDLQFLRNRIREEMIPHLETLLGKQIRSNLLTYSQDALELTDWLMEQGQKLFESMTCDSQGVSTFALDPQYLEQAFLVKFVLREFFSRCGLSVSRGTIATIYQHLLKRSSDTQIRVKDKRVHIRKHMVVVD